jgi:hypothetical protein|tara:strand:- start:44 stop:283 length:240 start_codon:yes stop_codon:yes gene_type:complete
MINTHFSKETARQLLQEKDNLIHFLKNDRSELLEILQRLVDFVENPIHSEDDTSPEYLTDGQMLDIVTGQIQRQINLRK